MNAIDGSDHHSKISDEPPPSLLTVILDSNPYAWDLLTPTLPLSAAIANLLVFINAHLAFNNANKVALIASHTGRAEFLYPQPQSSPSSSRITNGSSARRRNGRDADSDTEMGDDPESGETPSTAHSDANHYRPFRQIQDTLLSALTHLYETTSPSSLTPTSSIAGALTLALTHINKQRLLLSSTTTGSSTTTNPSSSALPTAVNPSDPSSPATTLLPRILILSVSGDLAHQYIPIMNTIFACQRLSIPIDICKLAGDTEFLQQASDATHGTYIKLDEPRGLLQYLMMGFLPDQTSRRSLVQPTALGVDFRAVCFCHRRVVDVGFVCSVCLSVFCSPPEGALCLTCGTHLKLEKYGGKPAVLAKKKKKKKKAGEETRGGE